MSAAVCSIALNVGNSKLDSLISLKSTEVGKTYKKVTGYKRVSVHDPSVVKDFTNDRYYVFGSHRASAVSLDMKNWQNNSWTYGVVNSKGTVSTVDFSKAFLTNMTTSVKVLQGTDTVEVPFGNFDCNKWRYTSNNPSLDGNQWAPDVIWNPYMSKWCMYMSLNGDDWRSVIVLLTSDKINGPYIYQGPVVFSGFQWTEPASQTWKQTDMSLVPSLETVTSLPSRYAVGSKWGNRWPNNIDPTVFFDTDGNLWMAYGSWSGGIFMLQLDRNNGLRDYTRKYQYAGSGDAVTCDPYFGKKIAGGYYSSGEGAYIEKIGNYYHLFVSYGGLNSDGGYEMRTYRSATPNGTYKDLKAANAIFTSYQMNYGPTSSSNAGNRLFGSYKWDTMEDAEIAQGHNSAFVDDDGKSFLIYHTRFAGSGEMHQMRVHQLFLNKDGWLLAAPYEYYDCQINQDSIEKRQLCSLADIEGTYKVIIHPYKLDYRNKAYQKDDATCYLYPDGTVTGDYTGTWLIPNEGKSYIRLALKKGNSASVTYNGVIVPQTISGTNIPSVCFMAVSNSGVAIWGSNADGKYAVDYNYVNCRLPFSAQQQIKEDLNIESVNTSLGAKVTISSSRPDIVDEKGNLHVTPVGITGNDTLVKVDMTCRIQKDNYYLDCVRTVRVRISKSDPVVSSIDTGKSRMYPLRDETFGLNGYKMDFSKMNRGLFIRNGKKFLKK